MRAGVLASCAAVLACAHGGPPVADLPTLAHAQVKPGKRLRLVSVWGREIWSGEEGTHAVAFMQDGKTAVAAGNRIVIFDVATRRTLRRFEGHKHGIEAVAVSPDGKTIATGGFIDHTIIFWDASTGARLRAIEIPKVPGGSPVVSGLAYSPDGKRIVAACHDQRLAVYDTATGAAVWAGSFTIGRAGPVSAAYSPDGKLVAAAAGSNGVAVWDAATGQQLWSAAQEAESVAFQDGELAAVGWSSPPFVIYDARTGAVEGQRSLPSHELRFVAAVPGKRGEFVVGESGSAVTIWDERGATSMYGHFDGLHAIAVSPDGRYAGSVSLQDGVRIWDLARRRQALLDNHDGAVRALAPSADGARLTSIGADGSILVRNIADGAILSRREGSFGPVVAAAFSADGDVAVISTMVPDWWPESTGPGVYVVDGRTAQVRAELECEFRPATAVAVSADGRSAMAVDSELWSRYDLAKPATGKTLAPSADGVVAPLGAEIQAAALLPDGDVAIVTGSVVYAWEAGYREQPGIIGRLRLPEGRPLWSLDGGIMTRLAAARDGGVAFAGDRAGTVTLVDLRTGKRRWPASLQWKGLSTSREGAIIAVALSPDGRFAAAADGGGQLRVWNVDSGLLYDMLALPAATALAFAPDSRSLYAGSANGIVFRFAL